MLPFVAAELGLVFGGGIERKSKGSAICKQIVLDLFVKISIFSDFIIILLVLDFSCCC